MKFNKITKFSDTVISVRTLCPFERSTITAYNLLAYMIKSKTEKYNSKERIAKELSKRYGMRISTGLTTYGNQISYQMRFQFIRHDWIKNELYPSQILEAIDQFLFHVQFDEESLEEAKYLLKTKLVSLMDDPGYVSISTALQSADVNHTLHIPINGCLDEIDSISLEDMHRIYHIYQNRDKHVYVCGVLEETLRKYLEGVDSHTSIQLDYSLLNNKEQTTQIIQKDIEQTYVSMIYATNTKAECKDYYSLLIMNSILGQAPMNLLFENVREKNSLCYSISSSVIRFDGVLYIHLGTKKHQVEKALSLIEQQIQRLQNMDYPDGNLEIAKKDLLDGMVGNQDYPGSYIESSFLDELLHRDETLEDRMRIVSAVTKEDVSRIAKRLCFVSKCIVEECEDAL